MGVLRKRNRESQTYCSMESDNVSVSWSIENFSFCPQKCGEVLQSQYFLTFPGISGTERGYLGLFPRGKIQNDESIYCCLYLHGYHGSNILESFGCSIKILSTDGEILLETKNNKRINLLTSVFEVLVSRNDIFKQNNLFLPNDTLNICLYFPISFAKSRLRAGSDMVGFLLRDYLIFTIIDVEKYSFIWNLKENIFNRKEITLSEKRKFVMTGIIKYTVPNTELKLNTEAINFKRYVGVIKCNLSLLRKNENEKMLRESEIFIDGIQNVLSNSRELTFSVPKEIFHMSDEPQLARLRCELGFSHVECEEEDVEAHIQDSTAPHLKSNVLPDKTKDNHDLLRDFLNMYATEKMTDVTLRVDEQIFQAHKFVLSARSPVFSAMFEKDMLENQSGIVDIKDIDADTLKNFLLFLYGGTIQKLHKESAQKLILVADRYLVTSLKEICSSFLVSNVTEETVCEYLILADMINDENLKESAINCFLSHTKVILESLEWIQFQDNHPKLAIEALRKFALEACSKPFI